MSRKRIIRIAIILTLLISNVSCDQISKNIVRNRIGDREEIALIHNYVTLTKVENSGAFLSLGNTLPESLRFILLSIMPLMILVYGLVFLFTKTSISRDTLIGLCFVIGGGLGNIYDRIVFGSVTDFLHIDFVIFQTGIFNMADVSIMVGMFWVLIHSFSKSKAPAEPTID
jgi:signal peptidase II